jgi:hypothetical protein
VLRLTTPEVVKRDAHRGGPLDDDFRLADLAGWDPAAAA